MSSTVTLGYINGILWFLAPHHSTHFFFLSITNAASKSFLNPINLIRHESVSPSWSYPRSLNCTRAEFGQLSIGCSNIVLRNESRGTLGGRSHFLRGECTVGGAHPNATLPGPLAASKTLNEGGVIPTRRQELIIFLLSVRLAFLSHLHLAYISFEMRSQQYIW